MTLDKKGRDCSNGRYKMLSVRGGIGMLPPVGPSLGWAWLALAVALTLHVLDEALTGFLSVYNPTVLAMKRRLSWFPMPVFTFIPWLAGLILGVGLMLALTPWAFSNAPWIRPLAYFLVVVMTLNGLGHIAGTIFGRTVSSVRFRRPMPGFYSSPLLLWASIYLLCQLQH